MTNHSPDRHPSQAYWDVYTETYADMQAGGGPIYLTQDQIKGGGKDAVTAAYKEAKQRGVIPLDQEEPEVMLIQPAPPPQPPVPGRLATMMANRTYRRRGAIAGAALVIGGPSLYFIQDVVRDSIAEYQAADAVVTTTRPVPAPADIAEIRLATEAACADKDDVKGFQPPAEVGKVGEDRYVLNDNATSIVVTGQETVLTIPKGKNVGEIFFCPAAGELNVIGSVGKLGVYALSGDGDAKVEIYGSTDQLYVENEDNPGVANVSISGHVGDLILSGYNDLSEDVLISGRVENALEKDSSHGFLRDFDTRGDGTVGRRAEY